MEEHTDEVSLPATGDNFFPTNLCKGFQKELDGLINHLASDETFKTRYLKSEYKSKYSDEGTVSPEERRSAAILKWKAVEESNLKTNMRLYLGQDDFGWTTSDILLATARRFVSDVLGKLDYPAVLHGGKFSNGASTRVRRSPKAALEKHVGKAHITSSCVKHWLAFASNSRLSRLELDIFESSVMFTVPKATEIDRVACKEPEINMFLQRQIGSAIRRKLKKVGINLRDQTRNQKLASEALTSDLATIDLSSASDSITKQLVMSLLPTDWFMLLDDLRVDSVLIDGVEHVPEMFSSMGNGFTFELESLLFWALTRAVCLLSGKRGTISVYGDDIIAPASAGPRLARIFSWLGFKVNSKKSHWSGSFRESCGKHYYANREVTPFYLRGPVRSKSDVIRVLNRLLQWDNEGYLCFLTAEVSEFHMRWAKHIPSSLYGGQDVNSIDALVTGHPPRSRLQVTKKDLTFDQQAGLEYWLTVREAVRGFDPFYSLQVNPVKEGKVQTFSQPDWLELTNWEPYKIHGLPLVHDTLK